MCAGVRHEGLLLPALFAVYIDNLTENKKSSGLGSNTAGMYILCLCLTDDIILVSHSIVLNCINTALMKRDAKPYLTSHCLH